MIALIVSILCVCHCAHFRGDLDSLYVYTVVIAIFCYGPILDRNEQLAWAVSMGSYVPLA